MAAPLDFCIHSHRGIIPAEGLQRRFVGQFQMRFGPLKVAPFLQHCWQQEQSSDKVYSLLCVDFPVGNNSPSRGV